MLNYSGYFNSYIEKNPFFQFNHNCVSELHGQNRSFTCRQMHKFRRIRRICRAYL